ncbi:DUF2170 family protein [Hahella ganghwensis]|uniref:DUF2170 family protein n=1 Tax=Hahella ganghwensis TaxID=286420 RepID=UPI00036141ED|nr:DUF2170 family protein [Hahella ganghwensis]
MPWNTDNVYQLLAQQPGWVVEKEAHGALYVTNEDGFDAFVVATEKQLIVESPLFPLSSVTDVPALDHLILRSHQLLPLTTVGIRQIDGEDYYVAFGSLSAESKDSVLIEEVEALFDNIGEFLELYSEYLNQEAA